MRASDRTEYGICEIFRGGRAVGLGFAIDRTHVATCAHVMNSALGRGRRDPSWPDEGNEIRLRFAIGATPGDDGYRTGTVVGWLPAEAGTFDISDVAVLELAEPVPAHVPGLRPLPHRPLMPVQMWGPQHARPDGGHVKGELLGEVRGGRIQISVSGGPFRVRPGFSGGPVWEPGGGHVVGVLSACGAEDNAADAYLLGMDRVAAAWPGWSPRELADDPGRVPRDHRERFDAASVQLGDPSPSARVAGAYAMSGLADDAEHLRQDCIDVLCTSLRMPYARSLPGAVQSQDMASQGAREVRHALIRIIAAHLQPDDRRGRAHSDWSRHTLDFAGVAFDGGDFTHARFNGAASFRHAKFTANTDFRWARFNGTVDFTGAQFIDADFGAAEFIGGKVVFRETEFIGGEINFSGARFDGSVVSFHRASFGAGIVQFMNTRFSGGRADFYGARFGGSMVNFIGAHFCGGAVSFRHAQFSGGDVDFFRARFSSSIVNFDGVRFTGADVSLHRADDWSTPPIFGFEGEPPKGLRLPPVKH